MMDWELVSKDLRKPLDPKHIKPPPKGKFGEYVDGLHVIREANRIFGEDGWSYEVTRLQETSNTIFDLTDQYGKPYQQVRVSWMCAVKVCVGGVYREGLAVGTGNGKPENIGDVIESAVKESETDALKRALRSFGNTFGLALYDKDKANREVGVEPEPFDHVAASERIVKKLTEAKTFEILSERWTDERDLVLTIGKIDRAAGTNCYVARDDRKAAIAAELTLQGAA